MAGASRCASGTQRKRGKAVEAWVQMDRFCRVRGWGWGTKKAQKAEALWAKFGEWAFATRSFPMV